MQWKWKEKNETKRKENIRVNVVQPASIDPFAKKREEKNQKNQKILTPKTQHNA